MAYSTIAEVATAAGGREKLRQLTDLENVGEVDETAVLAKIAEADSKINSYIEKRYAVPVDPAELTEVLRRMSAKLAVYFLREDREALTPEQDDRQAERITWLRGVADGSISLGITPRAAKSAHVRPATGNRESSERTITRAKFGGFT